MENKNISQIALEKIKESGMKPISKSIFSIKRVLFWSLVGFSIIIGSVSFSVALSILFSNDWDLYNKFGFSFVLRSLPYFWFVCILLLTILGEFYYRKTSLGYRHRTFMIVSVYVFITVILGSILHVVGWGSRVEESIYENIPVYHGIVFDKDEFWSHPETGLISGKIILIEGKTLNLLDFNQKVWIINMDNAVTMGRTRLEEGELIKIIGVTDDGNLFNAEQIRPWGNIKLHKSSFRENIMR